MPPLGPLPRTWCLWCDAYALRDAILNVLLFIPLGIGLGVMRARIPMALGVVVALTVGIEAAQLFLLEGRHPNARDVIANVVGGAIGLWVGWRWRSLVLPHRRRAWKLAAVARIVWVAVHLLAGWLLNPAGLDGFAGVIAGSHVGGHPDFAGRVHGWTLTLGDRRSSSGINAAIPPGVPAGALAVIDAGPLTAAATPFLAAFDSAGTFPFMLMLQGGDVLLSVRTRAEIARLRAPAFRYPDAVRPWYRTMPPPRNILRVTATRTSERSTVLVETSSGTRFGGEVPVRTTQGWTLVWPGRAELSPGTDMRSALWCLVLLIPLGYWTTMSHYNRRRMGWSLAAAAVGSGLIVGPLLFSQSYPAWLEVGASGGGLLAGALLSTLRTRRART